MSRINLQGSRCALAACGVLLGLCSFASADPLPGEQLKFFQAPLDSAPNPAAGLYPVGAAFNPATDSAMPFPGHDELSTISPNASSGALTGTMMADDFSDLNPLSIGHVTWWGSYMDGTNPANGGVKQFQVSLYTNAFGQLPTGGTYSEPGRLIATQTLNAAPVLAPSSGTFTESAPIPDPGSPDGPLYEYNGELNWQNINFPDAVYPNVEWLSIVAVVPNIPGSTKPALDWGWHDRDYGIFDPFAAPSDVTPGQPGYHFMDDAVSGPFNGNPAAVGGFTPTNYIPNYDGQSGSKDLAFALYTVSVPEPTSACLIGIAAMGLLRRRNRS